MKKTKKGFSKKLKFIFLVVLLAVVINFIPRFNLKTFTMVEMECEHFTIYYEPSQKEGAESIKFALEHGYNLISNGANLSFDNKTEVYLYDDLSKFQNKKYGLIASLISMVYDADWYVGDNIGNKVIMISPSTGITSHSQDAIIEVSVHEYVHALMWDLNPKLSKFLNEGMAGYISGNTQPSRRNLPIPTFKDTKIRGGIIGGLSFADKGLYELSYTYMEYIHNTYGIEKLVELAETMDYEKVFGKSDNDLYEEWKTYLKQNYTQIYTKRGSDIKLMSSPFLYNPLLI